MDLILTTELSILGYEPDIGGLCLNLKKDDGIMEATPTENNLVLKCEGFSTLSEAIDYAAQGFLF